MLNRRGFLGLLAGAAAGATLDPERLLWVPGKKLISIPKPKQPLLTLIEISHYGNARLVVKADQKYLSAAFPAKKFYSVGGQYVFPALDKSMDCTKSLAEYHTNTSYAYMLADDAERRTEEKQRWIYPSDWMDVPAITIPPDRGCAHA